MGNSATLIVPPGALLSVQTNAEFSQRVHIVSGSMNHTFEGSGEGNILHSAPIPGGGSYAFTFWNDRGVANWVPSECRILSGGTQVGSNDGGATGDDGDFNDMLITITRM